MIAYIPEQDPEYEFYIHILLDDLSHLGADIIIPPEEAVVTACHAFADFLVKELANPLKKVTPEFGNLQAIDVLKELEDLEFLKERTEDYLDDISGFY